MIAVIISVLFILYLPWLQYLSAQLKYVSANHKYYFYGENIPFFSSLLRVDFGNYTGLGGFVVFEKLITFLFYFIILAACAQTLNDRGRRLFLFSVFLYFLFYAGVDIIMGMRTLSLEKLMFFSVPLSFVFLSSGVLALPGFLGVRVLAGVLISLFLMYNTAGVISQKVNFAQDNFDGPRSVVNFSRRINLSLKADVKALVISDTAQRRYLLPFSHAMKYPVDIIAMSDITPVSRCMSRIKSAERYDVIFVMNCHIPESSFCPPLETRNEFSKPDIKVISDYLSSRGFLLVEPGEGFAGPDSLYIFRKIVL